MSGAAHIIAFLTAVLVCSTHVAGGSMPASATFVVAPAGDDAGPGTGAAPFATLVRARDAVRGFRKTHPGQDVLVLFRGGTYRLRETVVFSLEDSSPDGTTTTYAAWPGEEPVFTSGVAVRGWRKLERPPAGLPAAAHGKVWVADVPRGLGKFFTLYDGFTLLPRARCEGFRPTKRFTGWRGDAFEDRSRLHFPPGAVKNWPNLADVELLIIPTADWSMNILPLASVDEKARVAVTAFPGTYALGAQKKGGRWAKTAWIENAIDFLDSPGEWTVNTREGKVYLWPRGAAPGDGIVAPSLQEFIRVEGRIDHDGPADVPVCGIVFRGLTFTCGRRDRWDKDHVGWGLQHDWEMYDRGNAILRFRGAQRCAVENCRFVSTSGTAIRGDLHCRKLRIAGNEIAHVGGTGILLSGYGPGTKDVNRHNEIVGNHIHHVGGLYWHAAGIYIAQSGSNRVANNLVHHTPYTAIVVSGVRNLNAANKTSESARTIRTHETDAALKDRPTEAISGMKHADWKLRLPLLHARNNLVELNEIHHAMLRLGDGNGIYLSGAGDGNVIRRNYVHHVLGYSNAAIRTDGLQRGTLIAENIIYKCREGIILKDVNHAENNIIACLADDMPAARHGDYISIRGGPNKGTRIRRNLCYHTGRKPIFYLFRSLNWLPPIAPKDIDADGNLFFWTEDPNWGREFIRKMQEQYALEAHSISADPMFVDVANGDFRLKPGSPALKLGFKPIDISRIGLRPTPPRPLNGSEE